MIKYFILYNLKINYNKLAFKYVNIPIICIFKMLHTIYSILLQNRMYFSKENIKLKVKLSTYTGAINTKLSTILCITMWIFIV